VGPSANRIIRDSIAFQQAKSGALKPDWSILMNRLQILARVAVIVSAGLTSAEAAAFFHLWGFTEVYSNADGSVQFIEMRNTSNNEHFAMGAQIRSASTNKVFTFPSNLSSSFTANKNLLIATAGFGALPGGVAADFTLPSTSFFNPAGDTLTLSAPGFGTIDSRMFSSIPTDGLMSRIFPSNADVTNSPTNFSGASGSVNPSLPPTPTGDYNGSDVVDAADYVVWRDTLDQAANPAGSGADGDASGTIGAADYEFWRARFGNMTTGTAGAAAVPEPASNLVTLVILLTMARAMRCTRRATAISTGL
jgi:serralysin